MAVIRQDLGVVTAYAYAVAGGYTGTEAQFEALLGNIADTLNEFENFTVQVTTLAAGASATASYSDGVLSLGIPRGDRGEKGEKGDTGAQGIQGIQGEKGDTGNGIASITKTSTSGLVDTYTILFTDGTSTTFTVTNGEDGTVTPDQMAQAITDAIDSRVYKYDDLLEVIKITDPTTTMGDMVATLNQVNTVGDHVVFDVAGLEAGMYLCTIYLGNGYYRIADMVTGFEGTGFFSSSDLLKDIISSGSQSTGKHYTVRWDMVESTCERLNDAASITADTTNFKYSGSVNANYNNPFDEIYPWSGRKLCNIDIDLYRALSSSDSLSDCVVAWEDDAAFDYNHQYGVWVYTPPFFGRSYELGNYRYFDVTDENLQHNIAYPEMISGRWLGVDTVLTIDGSSKHCLLPTLGVGCRNVAVSTQHTYAQNYGATLTDIYTLDASVLLMVVEYASMNCQNAIGDGVSGLYRQSSDTFLQASSGITVYVTNNASIIPGAIFDIGTTNGEINVGRRYVVSKTVNGSTAEVVLNEAVTVTTSDMWSIRGLVNMADDDIGSKSGYIGTNGQCNAYYRGEVLWGNAFEYVLGAYRQTGTGAIWIAEEGDCDNYNALNTSVHKETGLVLPTSDGYVSKLGMVEGLSIPPFCTAVGGSATKPVGDYLYRPSLAAGNTILLLGGAASYGPADGVFCGYWIIGSGYSSWHYSSRPHLKTP